MSIETTRRRIADFIVRNRNSLDGEQLTQELYDQGLLPLRLECGCCELVAIEFNQGDVVAVRRDVDEPVH